VPKSSPDRLPLPFDISFARFLPAFLLFSLRSVSPVRFFVYSCIAGRKQQAGDWLV